MMLIIGIVALVFCLWLFERGARRHLESLEPMLQDLTPDEAADMADIVRTKGKKKELRALTLRTPFGEEARKNAL